MNIKNSDFVENQKLKKSRWKNITIQTALYVSNIFWNSQKHHPGLSRPRFMWMMNSTMKKFHKSMSIKRIWLNARVYGTKGFQFLCSTTNTASKNRSTSPIPPDTPVHLIMCLNGIFAYKYNHKHLQSFRPRECFKVTFSSLLVVPDKTFFVL